MPEGPEVRTIVYELNEAIKDKQIDKIVFSNTDQKISSPITNTELATKLKAKIVKKVNRIGKYIDIELDDQTHLVLHLLITGRLSFYNKDNNEIPKYFKASINFTDGTRLCLGDKRGWTKLKIMTTDEIENYNNFTDLGIDVFSPEYTIENFSKALNAKKPIYLVLMDQKIISGLGNIYVNEILFQAKVHPQKQAHTLDKEQVEDLYKIVKQIMEKAFAEKGTTVKSFLDRTPSSVGWHTLDGSEGGYYKYLKIFDKNGQECTICKSSIQKLQLGGRNAFYCPSCQPITFDKGEGQQSLSSQQQLCF